MRGLEAVFRVLGETRLDDPVESGWRHRLDRGDGRRLRVHYRADQRGLTPARERLLARRHLVENRAEGEYVGSDIGFLAFELLRRHVLEGPEDRSLLRQVHPRLRRKDRDS